MQKKPHFKSSRTQVIAELGPRRRTQTFSRFILDNHLSVDDHIHPLQRDYFSFKPDLDRCFAYHMVTSRTKHFCEG